MGGVTRRAPNYQPCVLGTWITFHLIQRQWNVMYSVHLGKFTLAQRKIPSRHHGRWLFFSLSVLGSRIKMQMVNVTSHGCFSEKKQPAGKKNKNKKEEPGTLFALLPAMLSTEWPSQCDTAHSGWFNFHSILGSAILLRRWLGNRLHVHAVLPFTFRWIKVNIKYVRGK